VILKRRSKKQDIDMGAKKMSAVNFRSNQIQPIAPGFARNEASLL
jgi:hypothetical protein